MTITIGDFFTIGFNTKGLKEFVEKLKKTKKELDETENKIEKMEQAQEDLANTTEKTTKTEEKNKEAVKETGEEIEKTKEKAKTLKKELDAMNNSTSGQMLQLQNNFTKLAGTMGKLAVLGFSLKKSLDFYEKGNQLDLLSRKTGIAIEQMQKLGSIASKFGGSTEDIVSTIQALNTKEGMQKAISMGITISNNPEQTLESIAAKMETLKTDVQKFQFAESLGLDEGTTRMLIEGVQRYREELKRTDKYRLYTKEDIERMRDYRQIQADIRQNVSDIQSTVAKTLLPAIIRFNKLMRTASDWAIEHEGAVKITTVFIVITAAIMGTVKALKALKTAGMSAFGWALAITGVIAYLQDLYTFINGGESLLGGLWQKWGYDLERIRVGFEIWGERIKIWWNNFLSIFDRNRSWQADPLKQSMLKPLSPEQFSKYQKYKETEAILKVARQSLNAANINPLNAISQNTIATYNSTMLRNENNNQNAKTVAMANNNQRITNIGSITVKTQASDGAGVARSIQTIAQADNGLLA